MTKALRQDPVVLYNLLHEQRDRVMTSIRKARKEGDEKGLKGLRAARIDIERALEATVRRLDKIAEEEKAVQAALVAAGDDDKNADKDGDHSDPPADDSGGDDSGSDDSGDESGDDSGDDDADESSDDDDKDSGQQDDEGAAEDAADEMVKDAAEQKDQDTDENEPDGNPVAMPAKLRREVGEIAADFLDEYGLNLYKKVNQFFDHLDARALQLGDADAEGDKESLRSVLKDEIGSRGLERLEPVFPEWRAQVVKSIMKTVTEKFQPPEEPEHNDGEGGDDDSGGGGDEEPESSGQPADNGGVTAARAPAPTQSPQDATKNTNPSAATPAPSVTGSVSTVSGVVSARAAWAKDFQPSGASNGSTKLV